MKAIQNTIKKGKTGLVFWFLTCLLGSFVVATIERYSWNQVEGNFMSITDLIFLSGILTAIALISSMPTILVIHLLSKKMKSLGLLINLSLLLTFGIGFFVVIYLSKSIYDTLQILVPFILFAFTFQFIFLRMEHSTTPNKK